MLTFRFVGEKIRQKNDMDQETTPPQSAIPNADNESEGDLEYDGRFHLHELLRREEAL